jgi:hypothetical protein
MRDIQRRLAKLEAPRPVGAAHRSTSEEEAVAHAELTRIMDAICAEKAAGDVHGVAARRLAELIAVSDQIAAERRA